MVVIATGDIVSSQWYPWKPADYRSYAARPKTWAEHFIGQMPNFYMGAMESSAYDDQTSSGEEDYPRKKTGCQRNQGLRKTTQFDELDYCLHCDCSNQCRNSHCQFCGVKSDVTDSDTDGDGEVLSVYWIKDLHLTNADKTEILNGDMLSDKHMYAAQKILSEQFPHVGGFQDTCLSQTSFQSVDGDCVQIHHTRGNHWVLTSWTEGDIVEVYDTIYGDITQDLVRQMEEIYVTAPRDSQGMLLYRMCDIPKQKGSKDCGLFVIALAFELCQGYDVTEIKFKQHELRSHLLKCFRQRHMESFPSSGRHV